MALYVNIQINDSIIESYAAHNISRRLKMGEPCTYQLYKYVDGKPVKIPGLLHHLREDGATVLASEILKRVVEDKCGSD